MVFTLTPPNSHRLILLTVIVLILCCDLGCSRTIHRRRILPAGEKSLDEWENVFNLRDDDDWRGVWHKEKHRRCQHQLLTHMELVCDKDIYKTARRKRSIETFGQEIADDYSVPNKNSSQDGQSSDISSLAGLFITPEQANRFGGSQLRSLVPGMHRRTSGMRRKRGISDECCSGSDGCSWEEYAEYCPANVRVRT